MIKANHKPFFVWFFKLYSKYMIKSHFHTIRWKGEVEPKNKPVLLIGNHFSWWDGFIANYVNHKIFRKKFHVMMLEEQLQCRMFLNKAGAYSIRKNSRTAIEALNYTSELLEYPENLVTVYPQGKFYSVYKFPFKFETGIDSVLRNTESELQIVFYAALVDYFSHRKPVLTLGMKEYGGNFATENIEKAYNGFFEKLIYEQDDYE